MGTSQRPLFSSRLVSILAMIGVAVGLGNVWRFPYMMGKFGGSAFLFVYLLFTILFAVPALLSEIALGRMTRSGPVGAFSAGFGQQWGRGIGYFMLFTILVSSSYYVVVIANVLFTAWFSASSGFQTDHLPLFEAQLNNGTIQYSIVLAVLLISFGVIYRGLKQGIEWVSKYLVPFFLLVIVYLIGHALFLEGAIEQLIVFLKPDFAALTAEQIFAALGQAIYSLSLGGTFMLMYGSYLSSTASLPRLAVLTSIGDVGAAVLASLFIVPSVLVFGLDMAAGPQLIFSTLPRLFQVIPGGQWIGTLFLLALGMVAILSLIGAFEVVVGSLSEELKGVLTRNQIILSIGLLEALAAIPISFHPAYIGFLDLLFGSGMQLLGCSMAVIALTWGFGTQKSLKALFPRPDHPWAKILHTWIKWIIPGILFLVLIGYLYDSFS